MDDGSDTMTRKRKKTPGATCELRDEKNCKRRRRAGQTERCRVSFKVALGNYGRLVG